MIRLHRLFALASVLFLITAATESAAADRDNRTEHGFTPLFDGQSLSGWTGATESYRVEDGKLICIEGSRGNLLTEKQYSDFVVRFEFRLTPGANNGLAIRSPLQPHGSLHLDGIEIQILDNTAEKYKALKPYQFHGSVYGVVPAKRGFLRPVGEWNEQEVQCRGPHIKVILNGTPIVDVNLEEAAAGGTPDGAEHPGLKRKTGHLGFLAHGDRIEVRNLRIKELQ